MKREVARKKNEYGVSQRLAKGCGMLNILYIAWKRQMNTVELNVTHTASN